jgi:beta-phosphoglucomutase-like phosphatase (HAD superfamily)
VIFDCDGVLADSEPAWAAAEREMCRRYGVDRDQEPRILTHGKSMTQTVRLLLPQLSSADLAEAEGSLVNIAAQLVPSTVNALRGAVESARILAEHVPIGVASNSPSNVLGAVLAAIGVMPYVSQVVAGDDVPRGKPEPDVYARCCELLGRAPRETVAFEDSLPGVLAAKAAGCTVVQVGVTGVPRFPQSGHFVEALEDLRIGSA